MRRFNKILKHQLSTRLRYDTYIKSNFRLQDAYFPCQDKRLFLQLPTKNGDTNSMNLELIRQKAAMGGEMRCEDYTNCGSMDCVVIIIVEHKHKRCRRSVQEALFLLMDDTNIRNVFNLESRKYNISKADLGSKWKLVIPFNKKYLDEQLRNFSKIYLVQENFVSFYMKSRKVVHPIKAILKTRPEKNL